MEVPKESLISISFREFNVESEDAHDMCSLDYILLRNDINDSDGDVTHLPIMTKACGSLKPPELLLRGNKVLIEFHSNHENPYRGFKILYNVFEGGFPN